MQYKLTTPCTAEDLAPLKAGDTVLLSGVLYTARDQAHKRMLEALDKGEKLLCRPHHQRPDGRHEPPSAGPGQQNHDRQG